MLSEVLFIIMIANASANVCEHTVVGISQPIFLGLNFGVAHFFFGIRFFDLINNAKLNVVK